MICKILPSLIGQLAVTFTKMGKMEKEQDASFVCLILVGGRLRVLFGAC